jgi:hypothetical protein
MKLYKLQIQLVLIESIEDAPKESEPPSEFDRHPALRDPAELQKEMLEGAKAIMASVNRSAPESRPVNLIRSVESLDVPASSYEEALRVLAKFHELGEEIGTPSLTSFPVNPMSFPGNHW